MSVSVLTATPIYDRSGRTIRQVIAGVPGLTGARGPQGEQGEQGPQGLQGPAGSASLGSVVAGANPNYALYLDADGKLAQEATVATTRLPATLAYKNASNTFTGATNTFNGHVAGRTAAFQSTSSTPAVVAIPSASSNGLEWRDSGNATAGYTDATGLLVASGAGLTNLPAGQLTGSVADARLSANVPLKNTANVFTAAQTVQVSDGSVPYTVNSVFAGADVFRWQIAGVTVARINSSGFFAGNGSALTNLVASNVATGTLADARLSGNVPLKDAANTYTAAQTITFPTTGGGLKSFKISSTPLADDLFFVDDAGNATVYGDLTADRLFGDVAGCTGYPAEEVDGLSAFITTELNFSATQRLLGRNTAGAGDPEEVTISQALDWVSSTANRIPYRGGSGWTTGTGLTYDGTTLVVREGQEWRTSGGTLYASALPGAIDTGLDDGYFSITRGGREYRIGSYNAAGAMVFKRSDIANYLGFIPGSTGISTFVQTGMLILGAGGDASSAIILTPNAGGGAYPVQFGRRHYDNNPAVGAKVEFWPVTGQTEPAAATVAPGSGTAGANPVAYRIGLMPDGTIRLHDASSTTAGRAQADIIASWVTSTDASRAGRLTLSAYYTTTAQEGLRVDGDTGGVKLGFFGGTAAAKPTVTGSRGGNAALASLLTALASLGLITDSSSA